MLTSSISNQLGTDYVSEVLHPRNIWSNMRMASDFWQRYSHGGYIVRPEPNSSIPITENLSNSVRFGRNVLEDGAAP